MAVFLDFKRQLKLWLEHIVHHVSDLQEETILFISFSTLKITDVVYGIVKNSAFTSNSTII